MSIVIADLLSHALAREATPTKLAAALEREAGDLAPAECGELAESLARYLSGLPHALDSLVAMASSPPYRRAIGFAAGQVLLYLVDENDLFPEDEMGALGLLDDMYLIHACLTAVRSTFPELSSPSAYTPPDARLVTAVRSLLPPGVADALDRACENLVRVAATLYSPGRQTIAAPPAERAKLRVDDALAALSG